MKLKNIVNKFSKAKVLIVGDLMLDRFIYGEAKKISPEAPVPVVEVKKETYCLGGAGNVANNITSLGGNVLLVGVAGEDYTAELLYKEMADRKIGDSGVFADNGRLTSMKTRIIAGHQQIVRYDKETVREISPAVLAKIMDFIKNSLPSCDAVLISDYGKGVITQKLINEIIRLAKKHKKIVTVDPKIEHFSRYEFVDCLTPNLSEAKAGMHVIKLNDDADFDKLGRAILKKLKCRSVLITQGESGMTLFESKRKTHIPTVAKEVFDVSGAGDTVIATLTLALASGASLLDAAKISNYAAGIVVGKLGTAAVSSKELLGAL